MEPLSYTMYWGRGYLVNHVLLNASMTVWAFLSGIEMTLNHPFTGSIIVNAWRECVDLGVRTTYGPIKSTLTRDHGSSSAPLGGKCPYFFHCFLNNWQVQHVLQNISMWLRYFGHVHVWRIIASVRDSPGWAKYSWYQATTRCWIWSGIYIFPWYVMTSVPIIFLVLRKFWFFVFIHTLLSSLSTPCLLRRYKPYYHL